MKKILVATLSSIILGTTLVSCTDTKTDAQIEQNVSISTEEIVDNVKKEIEDNIRKTALVEENAISEIYGIDMEDVLDITIENGTINTGLELIAIAKVEEGKMSSVKEALEKIIEDKRVSAFYPGEVEAVDEAKIVTKNNYIALFILPDEDELGIIDTAIRAFENSIN